MRIELDNLETVSGRMATEALLRDGEFLSDAWNQDLWVTLAAAAFDVPVSVAQDALRIDTRGKKRVKAIIGLLQEESRRHFQENRQ